MTWQIKEVLNPNLCRSIPWPHGHPGNPVDHRICSGAPNAKALTPIMLCSFGHVSLNCSMPFQQARARWTSTTANVRMCSKRAEFLKRKHSSKGKPDNKQKQPQERGISFDECSRLQRKPVIKEFLSDQAEGAEAVNEKDRVMLVADLVIDHRMSRVLVHALVITLAHAHRPASVWQQCFHRLRWLFFRRT